VYVRDVVSDKIVDVIKAVRCYRVGYLYVDVEYDPQRHIIYYFYISNRGNPHIVFYHIPPQLTESEARQRVLAYHGFA
jgi:hypothetical protein